MNSYGKHIKSHNFFIHTKVEENLHNISSEINEFNNLHLNNISKKYLGPESSGNVFE